MNAVELRFEQSKDPFGVLENGHDGRFLFGLPGSVLSTALLLTSGAIAARSRLSARARLPLYLSAALAHLPHVHSMLTQPREQTDGQITDTAERQPNPDGSENTGHGRGLHCADKDQVPSPRSNG